MSFFLVNSDMDVLTLCIMLLYSSIYAELMVECEPKDIRYVATEFDGWNERHWTVRSVCCLCCMQRVLIFSVCCMLYVVCCPLSMYQQGSDSA